MRRSAGKVARAVDELVFIEREITRIRKNQRGTEPLRSRALEREFQTSAGRTRADDRISALLAKRLFLEEIQQAQNVTDASVQICVRAWDQFSPALARALMNSGTAEILDALHTVSISHGHSLCSAWLRYARGDKSTVTTVSASDLDSESVPRKLLMAGEIYPAWREISISQSDPVDGNLALLAYSLLLDSTSLAAWARASVKKQRKTALDSSGVELALMVLIARGEDGLSREPIFRQMLKPPFSTMRRLLNIVQNSSALDLRATLDFLVAAEELNCIEERTLALAVLARRQRQSRKFNYADYTEGLYQQGFRAFDNQNADPWNLLKDPRNKLFGSSESQNSSFTISTPIGRFTESASLSFRIAKILGPRDMSRLVFGRRPAASFGDVKLTKISEEVKSHCSRLKGPLMKAGQTASYFSVGLPDVVSMTLRNLQSNAEPAGWRFIEETLVQSLGTDWSKRFLHIDTSPLAVGSIAQIHAAKLRTGEDVVLKVRLPDMCKIIISDMMLMRGLSHLTEFFIPKRGGHAIRMKAFLDELERQMLVECDFKNEAASMERARLRFAEDASIHIPKVYSAFTSDNLLVQQRIVGLSLEEALASLHQDQKDFWGEALVRFVVTSCRDADFNSDPHPGNFIFKDDGIYCLDFGSTIQWDEEAKRTWNLLIRACTEMSFPIYRSAFRIPESDQDPAHFDQFEAIARAGAGSWTHPVHQELSAEVIRMQMSTLSKTILQNERARRVKFPPAFLFGMRVYFGHLSVVARLGARANWNQIAARIMSTDTKPRHFL